MLLLPLLLAGKQVAATSSCPWAQHVSNLESSCVCDYNLAKELSVQCDMVNYEQLLTALHRYASSSNVDLFYVNNSTIVTLKNNTFATVKINNIQLSGCQIKSIEPDAFRGQENSLKSLNLKDNELTEIPSNTLNTLRNLTVLDLSINKITRVNDNAFAGLKLVTLKLSDNEVTIASGAFRGLEKSLKNLNLKGTRQKKVPEALKGLRTLAFVDLSRNSIRELPGSAGARAFEGLESLTGLNLERNLIQNIGPDAFHGVKHTLSSLSLLNNLIPDFPIAAINSIQHLRVLDIGFNLITELPVDAFKKNPSITFLAIDGNPLSTVPEEALALLDGTLRGLSLGGRFLICDCKLQWIVEWMKTKDLQVTSRERKSQFCGSPQKLQDKSFYNIDAEEMTCERTPEIIGIGTVESVDTREPVGSVAAASTRSTISVPTTSTARSITSRLTVARTGNTMNMRTIRSPVKRSHQHQPRPPVVLGSPLYKVTSTDMSIIIKDVVWEDNSVKIRWDTEATNIMGFKVIYKLFGDNNFKQTPPLESSKREFKIQNVPSKEYIVVCVVLLEKSNISPANVPYDQCKEVRTENSSTSKMNKITIAASATICATIVLAVMIFMIINYRKTRKLRTLPSIEQRKPGRPSARQPVNCCCNVSPTPSPGGPLSSMTTFSAYNAQKKWDQVSACSNESIPTPGIFFIDSQELRQSRQSLARGSDRMLRANFSPSHMPSHSSARRQRLRSCSRNLEQNPPRPSSRYSIADSTHTFNNCEENN